MQNKHQTTRRAAPKTKSAKSSTKKPVVRGTSADEAARSAKGAARALKRAAPTAVKPVAPKKRSNWVRPNAKQVKDLQDSNEALRGHRDSLKRELESSTRSVVSLRNVVANANNSLRDYKESHTVSNRVAAVMVFMIIVLLVAWIAK